jgi:hypothetical protein
MAKIYFLQLQLMKVDELKGVEKDWIILPSKFFFWLQIRSFPGTLVEAFIVPTVTSITGQRGAFLRSRHLRKAILKLLPGVSTQLKFFLLAHSLLNCISRTLLWQITSFGGNFSIQNFLVIWNVKTFSDYHKRMRLQLLKISLMTTPPSSE